METSAVCLLDVLELIRLAIFYAGFSPTGNLHKTITEFINFQGLGSMLADSSMITNLGALSAIKYLGPKPFLNITVEEYLWGYEDPLVEIAHAVVSNWISFTKLGILDRVSFFSFLQKHN